MKQHVSIVFASEGDNIEQNSFEDFPEKKNKFTKIRIKQ